MALQIGKRPTTTQSNVRAPSFSRPGVVRDARSNRSCAMILRHQLCSATSTRTERHGGLNEVQDRYFPTCLPAQVYAILLMVETVSALKPLQVSVRTAG